MNELIESGDPRAKVVGKRRPPRAGSECLKAAAALNLLATQLRRRPFRVKHGVYRFKTHKEADEWMMNLQLRCSDVAHLIEFRDYLGVRIPFASPALLWKTKQTFREKDAWDREFLQKLLIDRGEWPVE